MTRHSAQQHLIGAFLSDEESIITDKPAKNL
jgi:hypothetical protein